MEQPTTLAQQAAEPVRMAPRINPRRPYVIAANGLKRIILGAEDGLREALLASHVPVQKPLRSTQQARNHWLVLVHAERGRLDDHARQAIAAAALLAEADSAVVAAVLGASTDDLGACGADIVIQLAQVDVAQFAPELALELVQELIERYRPQHIILPDRLADADLGRRLAARTRCTIATDVVELTPDSACRVIPGGKYARCALPDILLLARHAVDSALPFIGAGQEHAAPLSVLARAVTGTGIATTAVRDLGLETSSLDQIELEEADFILSAGNGMRDMQTFSSLAEALGAVTGASRVAVDDGRFARARQIGASGKSVQASVYLAVGISGAVQHLQGIKDCQHVIAVNLDENAPIAKRADLTVVEDAQALMQALLEQVQQARLVSDK